MNIDSNGDCIHLISALKNKGISQLEKKILEFAHPGYWLFSEGTFTNRSQEEIGNEIVREKAFLFLNQVSQIEIKLKSN